MAVAVAGALAAAVAVAATAAVAVSVTVAVVAAALEVLVAVVPHGGGCGLYSNVVAVMVACARVAKGVDCTACPRTPPVAGLR